MKQFLITMAGVLAGLILFFVALPIVIIASISASVEQAEQGPPVNVSGNTVLTLDLRIPLSDQRVVAPFQFEQNPSVLDVVRALDAAATDDRVKALLVRASEYGMPPAQAEEIHDAMLRFRDSGKMILAHAQGFEGTSVTGYLAASAASEIWLQATSTFSATGLATETLFLGGMFDQYDVEADFVQFHEYKNAANTYTESDFTDAHRQATTSLLESLYDVSISKAARARDTTPAQLRALIESGPHSAETALEAGLIDAVGYYVDAEEHVKEAIEGDETFLPVGDYARAVKGPNKGPVIAVVAGQGAIMPGEEEIDPFGGSSGIFGDTMAASIRAAMEDDDVRAIVLRVDSPGGSAIASDQIWYAVTQAQAKGIPVVASFGSVSASGGYYISASADAIVAMPSTITGSIGVLGGKLAVDGALNRIGLNIEGISVGGEYASAFSSEGGFTEPQREAFTALMADIYDDFVSRVAEGREMTFDEAEALARGRVWTGAQAFERGLVSHLGGYQEALNVARNLAGLEEDEDVRIKRFPAEKSPFEAFSAAFGVSADGLRALRVLAGLADDPRVQALIEASEENRADYRMLRADQAVTPAR